MTEAPGPAADIHRGLRAGGIDFAVYLPDSVLYPVMLALEADEAIETVVCTREDEGVAIAAGAALAGRTPCVLMEGSGLGLSGLVLARTIVHHVPLLVLASHNRVLGEGRSFHAATNLAAEATLAGLGIPHLVVTDRDGLGELVEQAAVTVVGQRSVVGLLVPPHLIPAGAR
jgi:sulfopyruvate decarboxylase TPP-binding subunit